MQNATTFLQEATPYIFAAIIAVQGWMLKQIIDFGRWLAMAEERCQQHRSRDVMLEKQMPIAMKVLADHGTEMETLRQTLLQLTQKVDDGFKMVNNHLDKLDENHSTLLRLIPRQEEPS